MISRLTLAQIMWIVAVVALAFAAAPASLAIAFSLVLLVSVGIAVYSRTPWSRIAVWVFSCFPLLLLITIYTTWGAAWYALGHPPRFSLDDPKSIGTLVDTPYMITGFLFVGFLPALVVTAAITAIEFLRNFHGDHDNRERLIARVALPMFSWPLVYVWLMTDPGGVLNWLMD
ncbi:hypothetical protein ACYOEI_14750 [Singulisphaera rosea]